MRVEAQRELNQPERIANNNEISIGRFATVVSNVGDRSRAISEEQPEAIVRVIFWTDTELKEGKEMNRERKEKERKARSFSTLPLSLYTYIAN